MHFPYLVRKAITWTASSEFDTYRLCEQRRFRRACASAQSRQNLRCSLIQAVSQEEPSDRKPHPWSLWMVGHAQLKFVMTECMKKQIRLTRLIYLYCIVSLLVPGQRNEHQLNWQKKKRSKTDDHITETSPYSFSKFRKLSLYNCFITIELINSL